jgi:dynein heavy chain
LRVLGIFSLFPKVLDREGQMDNPCTSWLADAYWDNITELDKLTNFHGLMNSFEQYPRDWHLWYTNSSPEKAMLPGARLPAPASSEPV